MRDLDIVVSRFAKVRDGGVVDLSTGNRVRLLLKEAGSAREQTQWAARCDGARQLLRRSGARLVDYGAVDATHDFEAWTPHGSEPDATIEDVSVASLGVSLLPRRAVSSVAELFEITSDCRPRIVGLWGPPGAGKATALGELARAARLAGMVPVSATMLETLGATLVGRALFVIAHDARRDAWSDAVDCAMRSPRSHVVIIVSDDEPRGIDGIALERVSADAMARAVKPADLPPKVTRRVQEAAERSGGLPGRFTASLWGLRPFPSHVCRSTVRIGCRAAEQPAVYEAGPGSEHRRPADAQSPPAWPDRGELARLRRDRDEAVRHISEGRHAPGERALRQAIGGLARRGDLSGAGHGAMALGESLLKRGRPRDAQDVLEAGRDYFSRDGGGAALIVAATLSGHAWIDLARLDEAEAVLAAGLAAASAAGDAERAVGPSLAMARCLFWRGRYVEAEAILSRLPDRHAADAIASRIAVARSRVAVGLKDLNRAMSSAAEARQRAQAAADASLVAAAVCASAFAHLAIGDFDAVERDVVTAVASARIAHAPLRAIRARLLSAESERRRDRRSTASALLGRIERLGTESLPPIVSARAALLSALLQSAATVTDVVTRQTRLTGLAALTLFAPNGSAAGSAVNRSSTVIDDAVSLVGICQNADEDSVLRAVCTRLRRQLRAAGMAFVAAERSALVSIAADGRIEPSIASRAIASGTTIGPHQAADHIEAAAPVRYAGAAIAALVARWTLGAPYDLSGAGSLLTLAATVSAPAVAGALARRSAPAATDDGAGIHGVSPATAELRQAIERAAAAPFCVLIEGESGSGKELVARAVHRGSPRRARPFCILNCAALPDDLVESELFGHARGAFTGAVSDRPGVFEEANGGTLFLDEVGELSPRAQAKVLRVIQEGDLRRVGENIGRHVDVRILCATNRDLRAETAAGRFRLDLLYRLDVIRIAVAPLRERREDIAVLAERIWAEATRRVGSRTTLAAATIAALARYDWPGNVRELQNVLSALAVRTGKRGVVLPSALPPPFGIAASPDSWRLDEARRTFEERFVRAALVRSGGHRAQAALEMGLSRQGLTKLLARLGITS